MRGGERNLSTKVVNRLPMSSVTSAPLVVLKSQTPKTKEFKTFGVVLTKLEEQGLYRIGNCLICLEFQVTYSFEIKR